MAAAVAAGDGDGGLLRGVNGGGARVGVVGAVFVGAAVCASAAAVLALGLLRPTSARVSSEVHDRAD